MPIGRNELVRVRLEGIQPILRVENRQATLRFYLDILGVQNANWGSKEFTSVSRDRAVRERAGRGSGLAWMMSAGSMRN